MKILILFLLSLSVLFLPSCINDQTRIKKDLGTRFTKFEIIEIRKDSSFLSSAKNLLIGCVFKVSQANLEIIQNIVKIDENPSQEYKLYKHIDSVSKDMHNYLRNFEEKKYTTPDQCFRVKYLIVGPEIKTPKEEFYELKPKSDGDYNIYHRPIEWSDFMEEVKYSDLLDNAFKYYKKIIHLEFKYNEYHLN